MSDPWTIRTAAAALRAGDLTSEELTAACLAASDRLDEQLGTYIRRFDDEAMAAARRADTELAAGTDRGPLHGIPLGVKDIIATVEGPTTAQSLILPTEWGEQGDGPVISRLRDAGAVICGKTTTMEFAIGFPDFTKPFPIPRNPWNTDRWTGGSSSGTANGVASGQFLGGLGTDTGGSVRLPAAYCGISGHKPTFGLVPKSGCVPLGLSLDHIGPMTRSAWDCAAMLAVMAGPDPTDRTTVDSGADLTLPDIAPDGLRVGMIVNDSIAASASDPMMAAFDEAVATLQDAGATVERVEVPYYDRLAEGDFLTLQAEAFAWHRNHLIERWADYGRPTRLTITKGALISAGDLVQVERVRQLGRVGVQRTFEDLGLDVLLSPTTGYPATLFSGEDPRAVSMQAMHTPAWNATGSPALSVPMGFDDGLPLGLQIIGQPFADATVLGVGDLYQRMTDWHEHVAPVHA